ncbi:hypothetical protein DOV67_27970 [Salmonella enterica subsp. enterica serovar Java]|uniref:Uncharacterized protein n=3 Tax=Salmonella enterica TaxID=28901 RepID=A0A403JW61_SALER|nr:hypothetical protein [Salmonella enterica subsp. enterica serovar Java]EAO1479310.1 hypothetical protein [Salmonella enterica]HBM0103085.1 hypothetical protein [Salmonella enterica subsp. enterica serovar Wedding]EBR8575284.1 hypothetical protein [Salmonella enterica subsp. enterica serovar Java]ECS8432492.1 hypothetical protein [Salmonella enterica]
MSGPMQKSTNIQMRKKIRESSQKNTDASVSEYVRPHSDNVLGWVKEDRAVFWTWAYIRTATYDILEVKRSLNEQFEKPYDKLSVSENPVSTDERMLIIKIWYSEMKEELGPRYTDRIMMQIRDEWLYIKNNIKTVDWLRKNDEHTLWLWNHLKKEAIFSESIPFFFSPADAHERFLAINATIDFFMPDQTINVDEITKKKNNFTAKWKRNYRTRIMDSKKRPVCQISVKIAPDAKLLLDKMVRDVGTTQSKMIESLIRDRVAEGNSESGDNS